jgi:hypothetical protein
LEGEFLEEVQERFKEMGESLLRKLRWLSTVNRRRSTAHWNEPQLPFSRAGATQSSQFFWSPARKKRPLKTTFLKGVEDFFLSVLDVM